MAARLLAEQGAGDEGAPEGGPSKGKKAPAGNLLADERFQRMFQDPAFSIDQNAEEFKNLHPNARELHNGSAYACDHVGCIPFSFSTSPST